MLQLKPSVLKYMFISSLAIFSFACNANDTCVSNQIDTVENNTTPEPGPDTTESPNNEPISGYFKILSLGDSYTIGQSVCDTCRYPEQLKEALISKFGSNSTFDLKVIAKTGWTTTNLINAIALENTGNNYDLVTLLIGVNNQFQNKPFSVFESEFPLLVNIAIAKAKGDLNNVIVLSIPDYAFTPFGNRNETISNEIDKYNLFAETYCNSRNIDFISITDITRMGLDNTALVASDNLHPSELAYAKFVERILPFAIQKLKN